MSPPLLSEACRVATASQGYGDVRAADSKGIHQWGGLWGGQLGGAGSTMSNAHKVTGVAVHPVSGHVVALLEVRGCF